MSEPKSRHINHVPVAGRGKLSGSGACEYEAVVGGGGSPAALMLSRPSPVSQAGCGCPGPEKNETALHSTYSHVKVSPTVGISNEVIRRSN